jgi:hypothetical protein
VNTDFAQADVDRFINNTTRFSVFFPERRQFFLENASLFGINVGPGGEPAGGSMRIQPFFSRSIGLDAAGRPIPIDVGGRFVHRSSKTNFGAMLIRQRGIDDAPATNFAVGRFSQNFGKQNRAGGLLTVKNNPDGNTNLTGTMDAFFRIGEAHSFNTLISYSGNTEEGGDGLAAITQYYYATNQWKAWWTQSYVSAGYDPQMGFIARSDVIGTTPGVTRYIRGQNLPLKKWVRAYEPSLAAQFYHQASTGQLIERELAAYPFYLNLQTGGHLGYSVKSFYQKLIRPLPR